MLRELALTIPGGTIVESPEVIPSGGLSGNGDGRNAITNGIFIFLILLTVTALFFLIWGGIKWIMSGGEKSHIDSARRTITYAIIGLVVAFLSFFVINFVGSLFGVRFF